VVAAADAPSEFKLGKRGTHAVAFTGLVDLLATVCTDVVEKKKAKLDEGENSCIDDPFTWDLDVTVGSDWRDVVQVAPPIVVTDVFSSNADQDDKFQAGVDSASRSGR
jgi:hypothetical protein